MKKLKNLRAKQKLEVRQQEALEIRQEAAKIAFDRGTVKHKNNREEKQYQDGDGNLTHIANFTKGLPHNIETGQIVDPDHYQKFVTGINTGNPEDFYVTPLGPVGQNGKPELEWQSQIAQDKEVGVRAWESQGAGLTFDLEGPDAWAVTMPPAPRLDSAELVTEMTEVYLMALLRDVPFAAFSNSDNGDVSQDVQAAINRLNATPWISNPDSLKLNRAEKKRLRRRFVDGKAEPITEFDLQTVFRGITPGDDVGPYLSQFLLIGNKGLGNINNEKDGLISYGSLVINQRVRFAERNKDYMTTWEAWLDAQDGADLRGLETYEDDNLAGFTEEQKQTGDLPGYRFITTPRDLATYVHYDALYEAYLNACLIMLGLKIPFDDGIPFQGDDFRDKQQGFAHYGGPHILTLVTEVATRALKAVRYQKFNIHRRLRPEGVGGWVTRWKNGSTKDIEVIESLVKGLNDDLLDDIAAHNADQNDKFDDRSRDGESIGGKNTSFLLPMAFPEGSPMHPAYGAGHATVAGACVTILKAFFDHTAILEDPDTKQPFCYYPTLEKVAVQEGDTVVEKEKSVLKPVNDKSIRLTVEGELNKICSNISIGRNWAGVHYFTDYIESIRMGEEIALGILEEQAITYNELEDFSMTVPLFDGGLVKVDANGITPIER